MKAELNDHQRDGIYHHFEQTAGRFIGEDLTMFLARLNLLLLEALADESAARALITEAAQCSFANAHPSEEKAAR